VNIKKNKIKHSLVLSFSLTILASILLSLAYPSFLFGGLPLCAILAYYLLFQELLKYYQSTTKQILTVLIFNLIFSLISFYWIPNTLVTFGDIPSWASQLALVLLSVFILPTNWVFILIITYFRKKNLPKTLLPFALTIFFLFFEQLIPQQFPLWLGHSWLTWKNFFPSYYLPLASYFGVGIYSLLILFCSFLLLNIKDALSKLKNGNLIFIATLFSTILLFTTEFILQSYLEKDNNPNAQYFHVRIVQANVGNFLKTDAELGSVHSIKEVYDRYKKLTLENLQETKKLDLIIWPETAIPDEFHSTKWKNNLVLQGAPQNFLNILEQSSAPILLGSYDFGDVKYSTNGIFTEYNSALLAYPPNEFGNVYHKQILIPFGETLPFGKLNPLLFSYFPAVSLFSQGHLMNGMLLKNKNISFITPICYEILETNFIRDFLNSSNNQLNQNPKFIINLTNDSWYGETSEPYQHLFLAKWRAIEFRIPIIRSTNTGISIFIDENGNESNLIYINKEEYKDISLIINENTSMTIYQKYGRLPYVLTTMIFLILAIYPLIFKRKTFPY